MPNFATIAQRIGELAAGFSVGQRQREIEMNQQNVQALQLGLTLGNSGLDPNKMPGLVKYDGNTDASNLLQVGGEAGAASYKRARDLERVAQLFKKAEFDLKVEGAKTDRLKVTNDFLLGNRKLDTDLGIANSKNAVDLQIAGLNAETNMGVATLQQRGANARTEFMGNIDLQVAGVRADNALHVARLNAMKDSQLKPSDFEGLEKGMIPMITAMVGPDNKPVFKEGEDFVKGDRGPSFSPAGMLKLQSILGSVYSVGAQRGAQSATDFMNVFNDLKNSNQFQFTMSTPTWSDPTATFATVSPFATVPTQAQLGQAVTAQVAAIKAQPRVLWPQLIDNMRRSMEGRKIADQVEAQLAQLPK